MLPDQPFHSIWAKALQKFMEDLDDRVREVSPLHHPDIFRVMWAVIASERDGKTLNVSDIIKLMPPKPSANCDDVDNIDRTKNAIYDPLYNTKYKRLKLILDSGLIFIEKSESDRRNKYVKPSKKLKDMLENELDNTKTFVQNELKNAINSILPDTYSIVYNVCYDFEATITANAAFKFGPLTFKVSISVGVRQNIKMVSVNVDSVEIGEFGLIGDILVLRIN